MGCRWTPWTAQQTDTVVAFDFPAGAVMPDDGCISATIDGDTVIDGAEALKQKAHDLMFARNTLVDAMEDEDGYPLDCTIMVKWDANQVMFTAGCQAAADKFAAGGFSPLVVQG